MTRRLAPALALVLATGCIDIDFEPPHLVQTPRILAIGVDPPEAFFGEDIVFSTLAVDADGTPLPGREDVTLRWTICLSAAEVLRASNLSFEGSVDDDCGEGGEDLVVLEPGGAPDEAVLPGARVLALAAALPMPGDGPGPMDPGLPGIDPRVIETLLQVIAEVGVALRVRLEIARDGEVILTGFKRFALTTRAEPTTNPPPPRFAVNGTWLSARGGADPRVCVPEEGVAPSVGVGEEVDLEPDPDEEPWIESYPVFNLSGDLTINQESAYYSWFTTAGEVGRNITRRPERDTTWTAPEEPGTYPFWLVVRDGHLGMSWCRAEVEVR